MENDSLYMTLAKVVLPHELLESFEITKIDAKESEIHFYLDERMNEDKNQKL